MSQRRGPGALRAPAEPADGAGTAGPGASRLVALVAAVLGLGVSVYLTIEHYDRSVSLACPESSTVNCVKVTTSKWAEIAGVPVALLGLLYFVVMTGLLVAATLVRRRELDLLATVASGAGLLMVFYLVYVELLEVDAICLWCTAVHVLTAIMFVATLWRSTAERP